MTQPALSEQLANLERGLGVRLFDRQGDGVLPTRHGERFAPVAKLIEARMQRIGDAGEAAATKRITIGILPSVNQHGLLVNRITEAVLEVQERHPAIRITVHEAPNGTLQDWVMRDLVGLAVVETSLAHVPRLPLGSSERLKAIAHAGRDPLPAGPVTFAELMRVPLVLPTHRFGLRQLLQSTAEQRNVRIQPHLEIDALTMIGAVLARAPVCTVLPASAVGRELTDGELVAHDIVDPVIARQLYVIYSAQRSLSEPERDLVKTLRDRLTADSTDQSHR